THSLPMLVRLLTTALCAATLTAATGGATPPRPVMKTTYTYKRVGDLEIKADVHRFDDQEIRPVIVWIHGGALIMGGRERINRQLQHLAGVGAIIVSIDYRLAPETKLPAIVSDVE